METLHFERQNIVDNYLTMNIDRVGLVFFFFFYVYGETSSSARRCKETELTVNHSEFRWELFTASLNRTIGFIELHFSYDIARNTTVIKDSDYHKMF